ncbi:MAG: hypothetical protein IJ112_08285 [Oscillospiraceae bacterium]|nr:hypothetical protein [Oscillospiraceae bacterium]MBQ9720355.1 hypothetical protein [Oscillospiraceae bacterium]
MPERKVGNVKYKVQRSFCGERTAADLIKARMVAAAAKKYPQDALTDSSAQWYNDSGNKSDHTSDKEAF